MYIDECVYYIRNLEIPSEYEIDIITVQDAGSMTLGYNAAMMDVCGMESAWGGYTLIIYYSQSEEFLKAGYKIVVPYMDKPWCIHDEGFLNLDRYEEFRKIFLEEYMGGNNH